MEEAGKWLLVLAGVLRGKNVTFSFPLGLSIALSILLTVVLNLFSRR